LDINLSDFSTEEILVDKDAYHLLTLPGYGYTNEIGKPKLPAIRLLLAVPSLSNISLDVIDIKYAVLPEEFNIYPVQEPIPECGNYTSEFTIDESFYNTDSFYPDKLVNIGDKGILRDYKVILLEVFPFKYNPGTKKVKFYSDLIVELGFTEMPTRSRKSTYFDDYYKSVIDNYNLAKDWQIKQEDKIMTLDGSNWVDYLIIVNDTFYNSILPLAAWKEEKGYKVNITNTSDIPDINSDGLNASDVWAYINDTYWKYYDNLTYVLLVGDVEHIPVFYDFPHEGQNNHPVATDHNYSLYEGGDYFSELFVGRFSIKNTNELNVIVNKTINYEKYPYVGETEWYKKATVVSENAESAEETSNWIYNLLTNRGYVVNKIYDSLGNANPGNVSSSINNGRTIVNYRGHGTFHGWSTSSYEQHHIEELNNGERLPIIISPTCNTGCFDSHDDCGFSWGGSDCFGETWLKGNVSKFPDINGGVAFFGSTRTSYPGFNDKLDEGVYRAIFYDNLTNFAQAMSGGKDYMYTTYSGSDTAKLTMEMYNVLGDPELEIWIDVPSINVSACGVLNTSYVRYALINDVSSTGTCFTINVSNVVLDGQGHTITYGTDDVSTDYYGVYATHKYTLKEVVVKNLTVNTTRTARDRMGVYFYKVYNSTIKNIDASMNKDGIYIYKSDNNNINNVVANNNTNCGVLLYTANSSILDNITANNNYCGVYLEVTSNNNIVKNAITNNNSYFGISIYYSENNTLINTTSNNNSYYGIHLYSANKNKAEGAISKYNKDYGINLWASHYSTFTNIISTNNNDFGIYLGSSSNTSVVDSNISSNSLTDVYLQKYGGPSPSVNNTFLNVTYSTESVESESNLKRKWYLDVYANDTAGEPVNGVNITGWNVTGTEIFSELTGTNGRITTQNLTEYINNGGTKNFWTNYTVNASRYSILQSKSVNLTTNRLEIFNFDAVPKILFVQPTPENGSSTENNFVEINTSIMDNNVNIVIFNWNTTNYTFYNKSLILMYNFDNVSVLGEGDSIVRDLSDYGNNGSVKNNAKWILGGKHSGAFEFDGVNDYIDCGNGSSLDIRNEITIEFWAKAKNTSNNPDLITKGYFDEAYSIWWANDRRIAFALNWDNNELKSETVLSLNEWYHIAVTRQGTSRKIFINGEEDASDSNGASIEPAENLTISSLDFPFNGSIDEPRIWNISLGADEIKEHYYGNLYRYTSNNWALYVNQSSLTPGTYTYYSYVKDILNNFNKTETRSITKT
jgi:parallel beta-helix repeat protein